MRRIVSTVMLILLLISIMVLYNSQYVIKGVNTRQRTQVIEKMNREYTSMRLREDDLISTGKLSVTRDNYDIYLEITDKNEIISDKKFIQSGEKIGSYDNTDYNYMTRKELPIPKNYNDFIGSLVSVAGSKITVDNTGGNIKHYFLARYDDFFKIQDVVFEDAAMSSFDVDITSNSRYIFYVDTTEDYAAFILSKEGVVPTEYFVFSNDFISLYKYPDSYLLEVFANPKLRDLKINYNDSVLSNIRVDTDGNNISYTDYAGSIEMGRLGGLNKPEDLPLIVESGTIYNYIEYKELQSVNYTVTARLKAVYDGYVIEERLEEFTISR